MAKNTKILKGIFGASVLSATAFGVNSIIEKVGENGGSEIRKNLISNLASTNVKVSNNAHKEIITDTDNLKVYTYGDYKIRANFKDRKLTITNTKTGKVMPNIWNGFNSGVEPSGSDQDVTDHYFGINNSSDGRKNSTLTTFKGKAFWFNNGILTWGSFAKHNNNKPYYSLSNINFNDIKPSIRKVHGDWDGADERNWDFFKADKDRVYIKSEWQTIGGRKSDDGNEYDKRTFDILGGKPNKLIKYNKSKVFDFIPNIAPRIMQDHNISTKERDEYRSAFQKWVQPPKKDYKKNYFYTNLVGQRARWGDEFIVSFNIKTGKIIYTGGVWSLDNFEVINSTITGEELGLSGSDLNNVPKIPIKRIKVTGYSPYKKTYYDGYPGYPGNPEWAFKAWGENYGVGKPTKDKNKLQLLMLGDEVYRGKLKLWVGKVDENFKKIGNDGWYYAHSNINLIETLVSSIYNIKPDEMTANKRIKPEILAKYLNINDKDVINKIKDSHKTNAAKGKKLEIAYMINFGLKKLSYLEKDMGQRVNKKGEYTRGNQGKFRGLEDIFTGVDISDISSTELNYKGFGMRDITTPVAFFKTNTRLKDGIYREDQRKLVIAEGPLGGLSFLLGSGVGKTYKEDLLKSNFINWGNKSFSVRVDSYEKLLKHYGRLISDNVISKPKNMVDGTPWTNKNIPVWLTINIKTGKIFVTFAKNNVTHYWDKQSNDRVGGIDKTKHDGIGVAQVALSGKANGNYVSFDGKLIKISEQYGITPINSVMKINDTQILVYAKLDKNGTGDGISEDLIQGLPSELRGTDKHILVSINNKTHTINFIAFGMAGKELTNRNYYLEKYLEKDVNKKGNTIKKYILWLHKARFYNSAGKLVVAKLTKFQIDQNGRLKVTPPKGIELDENDKSEIKFRVLKEYLKWKRVDLNKIIKITPTEKKDLDTLKVKIQKLFNKFLKTNIAIEKDSIKYIQEMADLVSEYNEKIEKFETENTSYSLTIKINKIVDLGFESPNVVRPKDNFSTSESIIDKKIHNNNIKIFNKNQKLLLKQSIKDAYEDDLNFDVNLGFATNSNIPIQLLAGLKKCKNQDEIKTWIKKAKAYKLDQESKLQNYKREHIIQDLRNVPEKSLNPKLRINLKSLINSAKTKSQVNEIHYLIFNSNFELKTQAEISGITVPIINGLQIKFSKSLIKRVNIDDINKEIETTKNKLTIIKDEKNNNIEVKEMMSSIYDLGLYDSKRIPKPEVLELIKQGKTVNKIKKAINQFNFDQRRILGDIKLSRRNLHFLSSDDVVDPDSLSDPKNKKDLIEYVKKIIIYNFDQQKKSQLYKVGIFPVINDLASKRDDFILNGVPSLDALINIEDKYKIDHIIEKIKKTNKQKWAIYKVDNKITYGKADPEYNKKYASANDVETVAKLNEAKIKKDAEYNIKNHIKTPPTTADVVKDSTKISDLVLEFQSLFKKLKKTYEDELEKVNTNDAFDSSLKKKIVNEFTKKYNDQVKSIKLLSLQKLNHFRILKYKDVNPFVSDLVSDKTKSAINALVKQINESSSQSEINTLFIQLKNLKKDESKEVIKSINKSLVDDGIDWDAILKGKNEYNTHTSKDLLKYKKENIENKKDLAELKALIKKFQKEQVDAVNLAISKVPKILDLGYTGSSIQNIKKPIIDNSKIKNSNDVFLLSELILKYNEAQETALAAAKTKAIQDITNGKNKNIHNRGYKTNYSLEKMEQEVLSAKDKQELLNAQNSQIKKFNELQTDAFKKDKIKNIMPDKIMIDLKADKQTIANWKKEFEEEVKDYDKNGLLNKALEPNLDGTYSKNGQIAKFLMDGANSFKTKEDKEFVNEYIEIYNKFLVNKLISKHIIISNDRNFVSTKGQKITFKEWGEISYKKDKNGLSKKIIDTKKLAEEFNKEQTKKFVKSIDLIKDQINASNETKDNKKIMLKALEDQVKLQDRNNRPNVTTKDEITKLVEKVKKTLKVKGIIAEFKFQDIDAIEKNQKDADALKKDEFSKMKDIFEGYLKSDLVDESVKTELRKNKTELDAGKTPVEVNTNLFNIKQIFQKQREKLNLKLKTLNWKETLEKKTKLGVTVDATLETKIVNKLKDLKAKPFSQKDLNDLSPLIAQYKTKLDAAIANEIDTIPAIVDLGYAKSESGLDTPVVDKSSLTTHKKIVDIKAKINAFNAKQTELLKAAKDGFVQGVSNKSDIRIKDRGYEVDYDLDKLKTDSSITTAANKSTLEANIKTAIEKFNKAQADAFNAEQVNKLISLKNLLDKDSEEFKLINGWNQEFITQALKNDEFKNMVNLKTWLPNPSKEGILESNGVINKLLQDPANGFKTKADKANVNDLIDSYNEFMNAKVLATYKSAIFDREFTSTKGKKITDKDWTDASYAKLGNDFYAKLKALKISVTQFNTEQDTKFNKEVKYLKFKINTLPKISEVIKAGVLKQFEEALKTKATAKEPEKLTKSDLVEIVTKLNADLKVKNMDVKVDFKDITDTNALEKEVKDLKKVDFDKVKTIFEGYTKSNLIDEKDKTELNKCKKDFDEDGTLEGVTKKFELIKTKLAALKTEILNKLEKTLTDSKWAETKQKQKDVGIIGVDDALKTRIEDKIKTLEEKPFSQKDLNDLSTLIAQYKTKLDAAIANEIDTIPAIADLGYTKSESGLDTPVVDKSSLTTHKKIVDIKAKINAFNAKQTELLKAAKDGFVQGVSSKSNTRIKDRGYEVDYDLDKLKADSSITTAVNKPTLEANIKTAIEKFNKAQTDAFNEDGVNKIIPVKQILDIDSKENKLIDTWNKEFITQALKDNKFKKMSGLKAWIPNPNQEGTFMPGGLIGKLLQDPTNGFKTKADKANVNALIDSYNEFMNAKVLAIYKSTIFDREFTSTKGKKITDKDWTDASYAKLGNDFYAKLKALKISVTQFNTEQDTKFNKEVKYLKFKINTLPKISKAIKAEVLKQFEEALKTKATAKEPEKLTKSDLVEIVTKLNADLKVKNTDVKVDFKDITDTSALEKEVKDLKKVDFDKVKTIFEGYTKSNLVDEKDKTELNKCKKDFDEDGTLEGVTKKFELIKTKLAALKTEILNKLEKTLTDSKWAETKQKQKDVGIIGVDDALKTRIEDKIKTLEEKPFSQKDLNDLSTLIAQYKTKLDAAIANEIDTIPAIADLGYTKSESGLDTPVVDKSSLTTHKKIVDIKAKINAFNAKQTELLKAAKDGFVQGVSSKSNTRIKDRGYEVDYDLDKLKADSSITTAVNKPTLEANIKTAIEKFNKAQTDAFNEDGVNKIIPVKQILDIDSKENKLIDTWNKEFITQALKDNKFKKMSGLKAWIPNPNQEGTFMPGGLIGKLLQDPTNGFKTKADKANVNALIDFYNEFMNAKVLAIYKSTIFDREFTSTKGKKIADKDWTDASYAKLGNDFYAKLKALKISVTQFNADQDAKFNKAVDYIKFQIKEAPKLEDKSKASIMKLFEEDLKLSAKTKKPQKLTKTDLEKIVIKLNQQLKDKKISLKLKFISPDKKFFHKKNGSKLKVILIASGIGTSLALMSLAILLFLRRKFKKTN